MHRIFAIAALLACACAGRQSTWEMKEAAPAAAPAPAAEGGADPAAALIAEGDAAWEKRGDMAESMKAIEKWEAALALSPQNGALLTKLSHGCSFHADAHLRKDPDKSKMKNTLLKGVDYGERALVLMSPAFAEKVKGGMSTREAAPFVEKEAIEPLYWYGVNLGRWARADGFTTILGQRDNYKATMERVYALDPAWYYGAAPRALGALYAVAPSFAGGDPAKAKKYYDESLAAAPNWPATKVLMAENWATKTQDRATFDKLLNEVLSMPDDAIPEAVAETRAEKEKAKEFLDKAEDLF
jgi:hypothetical protein